MTEIVLSNLLELLPALGCKSCPFLGHVIDKTRKAAIKTERGGLTLWCPIY